MRVEAAKSMSVKTNSELMVDNSEQMAADLALEDARQRERDSAALETSKTLSKMEKRKKAAAKRQSDAVVKTSIALDDTKIRLVKAMGTTVDHQKSVDTAKDALSGKSSCECTSSWEFDGKEY